MSTPSSIRINVPPKISGRQFIRFLEKGLMVVSDLREIDPQDITQPKNYMRLLRFFVAGEHLPLKRVLVMAASVLSERDLWTFVRSLSRAGNIRGRKNQSIDKLICFFGTKSRSSTMDPPSFRH